MTRQQQKRFRAIGHELHPVVTIAGKGLSESVAEECERALNDHELIKVRITAEDREHKPQLVGALLETTTAELVQLIGHVALIYRPAAKPNPKLSTLLRSARPAK